MKAIYKNIAIAALALSAVACTQEEDLAPSYLTDPQAVRISAQVASGYVTGGFTRSNPLGTEAEQAKFNNGDQIAVTAGTQAAVTYTFDGTDTWTPGTNQYLKWESNTMTFNAWYPVGGGIDAQNFTPSYRTASLEELQANDYMTFSGVKTKNGNDNSVSIKLNRQMARIVISEINYGNQYNSSTDAVASIAITAGSSKYASDAWDDTNVTAQMYEHTDDAWYAVLPPTATAEPEETFLTITLATGETLTVKGIPVTVAGKTYEYTLTVGKDKATIGSVTVNPWTDGTVISSGKAEEEEEIPYLTFTATDLQILTLKKNDESEDGVSCPSAESLEYSVNGGAWTKFEWIEDFGNSNSVIFGGENGNLRMRGKSESGMAADCENYIQIIFHNSVDVACSGDIRTLVNYENYSAAETDNARFCYLFSDCSNLTSAPALPAATLTDYCYYGMFSGCTSLTSAPSLPATSLADHCYESMFSGCSSLTSAPSLPAATLADHCYESMFSGCTSLTSAPSLPATSLQNNCYYGMFLGCTSLTSAPSLPATSLAVGCYWSMFSGCSSLTSAPALPATSLAVECYQSMFSNCTSLTSAPSLPATSLKGSCYKSMFSGCSSLTSAPELSATSLTVACYQSMFSGCSSLTSAPSLPATSLHNNCYYGMFSGCTNLNSVTMLAIDISASNCLNNWLKGVADTGTFIKAASMELLPTGASGIPSGWTIQTM